MLYTLLHSDGTQSAVKFAGSAATLDARRMQDLFAPTFSHASVALVELFQLPVSGVRYLLDSAQQCGVPAVLDVAIPPSVAVGAANIAASVAEVEAAVRQCTVLKLHAAAAAEVLRLACDEEVRL